MFSANRITHTKTTHNLNYISLIFGCGKTFGRITSSGENGYVEDMATIQRDLTFWTGISSGFATVITPATAFIVSTWN